MRPCRTLLLLAGLSACAAVQERPAPAPEAPAAPAPAEEAPADAWELSVDAFYSDPPGSEGHATAVVKADRGPVHLETRYGYEDLDTLSLFAGWNFSTGETVTADVTPMIGVVGGDTDGVAPGLEAEIAWDRLAWYVEAEYLFDNHDSADDYFYSWSTLTWGFTDWLRAGLVAERTKLVDTDLELQRGLAIEISRGPLGVSLYAYNLGSDDEYAVIALGYAR
jgi:hypothetical protein